MVERFLFKVKLLGFVLCLAPLCEAKVKLPALISDGMVLQREQPVNVWGTADAGETIELTFQKKKYVAEADSRGFWALTLPPSKAGGPYVMAINETEITDILIGDVYLCSGQSNMELPIARVTDMFREEIEACHNSAIRHIKVPLHYDFDKPQSDIQPAAWKTLNSQDAMQFSALAYFFAKAIYEKNKIPVGLINSSAGGTPVEAWISEAALNPFPKYLNEKELFASDDYIQQVRTLERTTRNRWHQVLYKADDGLHEVVKWYADAYDDSSWETVDLFDTHWGNNGLNPINGSHWFRKEIELDEPLSGQSAVLRMGCVVDADSVYVNGHFVGSVSYQYPPRIYNIPEGILKAGKNQITVRVVSNSGQPQFVPEKPYKIVFGGTEISLEGCWKYKQGASMPPLQGETFFQYKPLGLYNGMIAPLKNYTIKGVVWYQGESNTGRYNEYYALLRAMIADWRETFAAPELPFVIVELAQFGHPSKTHMLNQWAAFRGEQRKVVADTPGTALAEAYDLGEWNDIHPLNKKGVGERVAEEMLKLIR